MNDHPKDTSRPPDSGEGFFREVFLAHLPGEAADAARRFGRFILLCLWESSYADWEAPREFAGIALDLDACAQQLAAYLDDNRRSEGLRDPVEDWRARLEALAGEIRDSLEAPPPAAADA